VLELGERTHGAMLPEEPVVWHDATRIFGVAVPRDELVLRLDTRVEGMWRDGILDEVRALRDEGLERGVTARRAIGYAQALAQLSGEMTEAEAIAETQALTRRYARRQVSWFRRYDALRWVESGVDAAVLADSSA
jgi:tRNA dimethylallyltransferase